MLRRRVQSVACPLGAAEMSMQLPYLRELQQAQCSQQSRRMHTPTLAARSQSHTSAGAPRPPKSYVIGPAVVRRALLGWTADHTCIANFLQQCLYLTTTRTRVPDHTWGLGLRVLHA